jgi:gamma-glutamyltranspeptidase/glutathione hydrolase
MMHLPTLCKSLQVIAEGGAEAFYKGDLATKIANYVQAEGGWVTANDFAIHKSDWDEPIKTQYRGTTVWECPPNGHGIAALISLNIAEGFDIANMGSQSADWYHYLIESMRLGYADSLQYVADPRVCEVPIRGLLSKEYSTERRGKIEQKRSMTGVHYGQPVGHGDTVYLSVVDGQGNACSFINSLYQGFGTGLVVPGTGIALQNRGALFSLDPHHPNYLEGGKRPYQTIIPAIATREDELWLCFGVMGGFQQPQGHLQVISNMVDFGMDSQRALDALRFSIDVQNTGNVRVEEGIDPKTVVELRRRGHDLSIIKGYERGIFGGGQVISRDPLTGVLIGGSEPRKDGGAVGW